VRPISLPDVAYGATAVRPQWHDLPETLRHAISARLGAPVVSARSAGGGFTRAFAAVLTTSAGLSAFVKAASLEDPNSRWYAREAALTSALPPAVAAARPSWTMVDSGYFVLCLEAVDGRVPSLPWSPPELAAALSAWWAAAEALREPTPEAPAAPVVPALAPEAPAAAAAHEAKLAAAGISASLAADIVGEAVAHGLPLAGTRQLKKLVRATLARRIPVLSDIGPGSRRVAFVGAGGAGKSAAVAALAKAYAQADAEVVVVALRSADGGCDLAAELEPHGVSVVAAGDAAQAERRLARRQALLTLVDTPAAGLGDRAGVAGLAKDLEALGVDEVHLTLPAILSAAAADELAGALAPLGITNVALTHADQTARPGAPVELAMTTRKPMSYVCGRDAIELADAADLAQRLLP
jgi:hypothetical protein